MANTMDVMTRLWIMTTSELMTAKPICIRKVQLLATAKADVVHFYSLPGSTAADHDNYFTNLAFDANTYTITDSATGNIWTGIAANDWVHITECSITANDGWYYLKTDGGNSTFDIEHTTNALTAGTGASARIQTYTPTESMMLIGDTLDGTAFTHPILDWGDKGRWFEGGLSFQTADTLSAYVYIK